MEKNVRVQKIIAESGYCSRRKAEEFIEQGKVTVNNKKITIGDKADPDKDLIKVGKEEIKIEKKVYIMMNKPKAYITTNSDLYDRRKVIDLIDVDVRVFPVGRLDRDAMGLLLLTNDGEWANKIMHPKFGKEKEYEAELDKFVDKKTIQRMNDGFKLKDGYIKPRVKSISKNYCSVVIHEGRNKIVKRIFNEFGFKVKTLKRVRVGPYKLKNLKPKQWVYIDPHLIDKSDKFVKKPKSNYKNNPKTEEKRSYNKKPRDNYKNNFKTEEKRSYNKKPFGRKYSNKKTKDKDVFDYKKYNLKR